MIMILINFGIMDFLCIIQRSVAKRIQKNAVLTFFVLAESTQVKWYKCLRLYTV